jgi:hypothetical protein
MSVSRRIFSETTVVITKLKERKTMERVTSKLTRVLVITLLSAATLATAGSLTLKASSGVTPQDGKPLPSHPVCQRAYDARLPNSASANDLQVKCILELATWGKVLAGQYPWAAVLLRDQVTEGSARRGFYIGLAASEGQTEDGPGKQWIRASLIPTEQSGFNVAVSETLGRNKNPEMYRDADLPREADMPREDSPVRRGSDSRSLRATLEHLRQGKEYLEDATPDQDGHVYKAIDDINNAIQELEKARRGRN